MNFIIHLIDLVTSLTPKKIRIPVSVFKVIIAGTPPNSAKDIINYRVASSDLQLC